MLNKELYYEIETELEDALQLRFGELLTTLRDHALAEAIPALIQMAWVLGDGGMAIGAIPIAFQKHR